MSIIEEKNIKCPYCEMEFATFKEVKYHCYESCELLIDKNCDARVIQQDVIRHNPPEEIIPEE